jgi:hypothetical protein
LSRGRGIIEAMNELAALEESPIIRDDDWLADRLADVWYHYFPDIAQPNEVIVRFGRKSKTRLGSIGMEGWRDTHRQVEYRSRKSIPRGTSIITLTGYFKDDRVPLCVVESTIGHELVHYAHGFHSPHPQLYRHPHQGGIVDKEMKQRGMGEILKLQKAWLKKEWPIITQGHPRKRRIRRRYGRLFILPAFG